MRILRARRGGILAWFFLLALANCGGGGGGGDDGGGGGAVADFTASCDPTNTCYINSVTLQKGTASGNVVEVRGVLNKLNTTIGVASLLISFDPTVVDYKGYAEGPALGTTAQGTLYEITETTAGELLVDILPPAGGVSVSSPQVMVSLSFKVLKVGSSNLIFKSPNTSSNGSALFAPAGNVILGVNWSGGLATGS